VHIWRAAVYAGDWVFNPAGISKPPPALASGKSGTPCERMHPRHSQPRPFQTENSRGNAPSMSLVRVLTLRRSVSPLSSTERSVTSR